MQLPPLQAHPPVVTETLQAPVRELTTGSTFAGRYQVIEELGHGGMGRVYKVQDTDIKEKVALKLLRPEITLDKEAVERFSNELKLARKISHRNVCRMFDLGRTEGTTFITMEFVPGEDLKSFIHRAKQLNIGTAISIAKQVCEGLEEAHRLGIVHRDLKPGNIMIDKDGDAKIMDFGIARSLTGKSITGAGTFIGTPEYMSPEQVEGKDVDHRSDIYSLGIILYEMVAGRRPFDGETALSIAHKQKYELPEDPRTINPQVPEVLARAIIRCLEKDKAARYESARSLETDLAGIEEGLPITEKAVQKRKGLTTRDITVKFNLRMILLPAILVLAAIAAAVFFLLIRKPGPALNPKLALVSIFVNQTGDATLGSLGQYTAEVIAQGLSQSGIMEVVPTMSVLESSRIINSESGVPKDENELLALAKSTGAGTLVSGAFYLIDNKLQFHASITDVAHRKPMLIQSLEPLKGSLDDKMGLITELRQRVMGALAMHFTNINMSEMSQKLRRPPVYEAYQEFLQGFDLWGVDYEQSVRHFTRAVELDPSFAAAKTYIASGLMNQGQYAKAEDLVQSMIQTRNELSPLENRILDWHVAALKGRRDEAHRAMLEAEKLAPNNIVINRIAGSSALIINRPREAVAIFAKLDFVDPKVLYGYYAGSWTLGFRAEALHMLGSYDKELEVIKTGKKYYPRLLSFRRFEARALAALGKTDEVRTVIEECLGIESTDGTPGDVMMETARELYAHGHNDIFREIAVKAIEWAENRPEAERKAEAGRRFYADALYTAGRWDEAGRIFGSLAAEQPDNIDYQGYLGTLAARKGDREAAMKISDELAAIDRRFLFGSQTYWRACIAALLGDKERAVALLKETFSQGRFYRVGFHRDIFLAPLWDYPPFKELLRPKG
ncbi:MAG: Serine/threonine-protein kinase PknB [Candidatus Aminicenantes bacterium]|nr:Serine/threonine-protein kinase PknB [Candidatus Aminicenantes bacterium]